MSVKEARTYDENALSNAEKEQINAIYGKGTVSIDRNGNGTPDELEPQEKRTITYRHRKWEDKMHTATGEAVGYLTGKAQEETELTYEE